MGFYALGFICDRCKREFPLNIPVNTCPACGGLLETQYNTKAMKQDLKHHDFTTRVNSIWRWKEFLPLKDEHQIVTMGEGGTPLLKSVFVAKEMGLEHLYFKNDALMPTGSFKDRGFSLAVSFAKEIGVQKGITYSSGNAGSSFAAYASRAEMNSVVMVEYVANPLKKAMIGLYGARTAILNYESMNQITEMLEKGVKELGLYQFVNFINPIRHEAMKTYAYEIAQQLDWRSPDVMVHPVGTGGGIWGAYKGFKEIVALGWIDHLPRMISVQPDVTAHFYHAFKNGSKTAGRFGDTTKTIAQSIAADAPIQGGERILKAVYESNGFAIGVSDVEILEAMRWLGKEGISAEPASAASLAAVIKAVKSGQIISTEKVVCVITGSGLKQPAAVQMAAPEISLELNASIEGLAGLIAKVW